MKDFRTLEVWKKGRALALAVYKATGSWPPGERFGMTAQVRRAAVSVVANIAEGCGRDGNADFARMLQIAMGSVNELDALLDLAEGLGYLSKADAGRLRAPTVEVQRMLASLIRKVRSDC